MANRQFAIGNLLAHTMITCPQVKVKNDMVQSIKVPTYANVRLCNLVEINGKYYDILGIDDRSNEAPSIELSIALNPVLTYLQPNESISGWFDRTPSNVKPGGSVQIGNDAFAESRRYFLNRLSNQSFGNPIPVWIQIAASENLVPEPNDMSSLTLYGTLASYEPKVMGSSLVNYTGATGKYYMSLKDIISDVDTLTGLESGSIIDISVSSRCPWAYSFDGSSFHLNNASGGAISPLTATNTSKCFDIINDTSVGLPNNNSHTIQFSALERYCGKFTLVDEANNDIAVIPNQYLDANNQLEMDVQTTSDITGIYTNVLIRGQLYTLQEGHLPYIGDTWNDYKTLSLNADREALARGVDTVNKQRDIDMMNIVGNGISNLGWSAFGGPAMVGASLASMGITAEATNMQADLAKRNLYAEQSEKEGVIKNAPSNNYQTGYGFDYLYKQWKLGGAHIRIELPANLTQADFDNYIAYQGWPCNKFATLNVVTGYIKGNLYNVDATGTGPELDSLRREVAQGFRMVTI